MSLWNRNRPLNQPPVYGRIQAPDRLQSSETAERIARAVHLEAQFTRWEKTQKLGMRAVVKA